MKNRLQKRVQKRIKRQNQKNRCLIFDQSRLTSYRTHKNTF